MSKKQRGFCPNLGDAVKPEPQDDVDWEKIAAGVCANVDQALQDHIRAAKAVSERRHAETSAVLGFDTKALERELLSKVVPRITIRTKTKAARPKR